MRLDQVKTAKGDTFYKLQSDLKNLAGTELTDANGNLRSTYDIILDLSKAWASLSDMNQAKLLDEIAGKNQAKVLSAILQNAQQLPKAYDAMKDSAGSASKEQERYMDSIEAKANALKESVKKLWIQIISSDTIKQFVDFLTQIVASLSEVDGSTVKLIATFTALGLALKTISSFTTSLKGVETIASLGKDAGLLESLIGGFGRLGTSIGGVTSASLAFIATPLGATLTALAVTTGIAVASYETYQNLLSKPVASTSTENLSGFEKVINSLTGNTIKSKKELQDMGLAYEDFSSNLSGKFKDSVEDASKAFNKLKMTLTFDDVKGDTFTDSMSQEIKDQVNNIVDSAKKAVLNKRGEMKETLSNLFSIDGKLDDGELGVMTTVEEYQDSKFETIQSLNQNIYDTLNKAVEEHRKLTEEDINNIKNWTQQVQALQIEANAQNDADKKYSSNAEKFKKRLSSMTPDEALSSAKEAYNQIIDIGQETEDKEKDVIAKANSLKNDLQNSLNDAIAKGDTAQADKLRESIKKIEEEVTTAQDGLNNEVKKRQEKTSEIWEAFYSTNENLRGKINEVTFTQFTKGDYNSQDDLSKMESQLQGLADVTESGMVRIKNANGYWHDVQVTVDEATGHIISAYDTTNGKFGGYSKDFADKSKEMYQSIYEAQQKIVDLIHSNSSIKLDEGNNLYSQSADGAKEDIEQMQKVIELSNGYKEAITNINGTQIKMKFDKDGTLKNYEDVMSAINGNKESKAIVDVDVNNKDALDKFKQTEEAENNISTQVNTKITVDGDEISTVDDAKTKLDEIAKENPEAKITINGEDVGKVEDAKKKVDELNGQEANVDIVADNSDANNKIDDTSNKAENLDGIDPEIDADANTNQADSDLDTTSGKVDELNGKSANPTITIEAGNSLSIIDRIRNFFDWITGRNANATVNVEQTGNAEVGHNAKGDSNWKGGFTYINENEEGELVDLPSGTRIIPHDLSEKIIEEEAKNSNKGNITVNNIDIYEGKENETGTLDVDKADTIDKPYTPEVDTSGMSEDEKKAYDEKKKAEEDEEKRLKDKADKEKQYLDDIGSYWKQNEQSVTNSMSEIELKEKELGDNPSYVDKINLLNQKYQLQLSLLPEAEKELNTYKNTTVTTAEAQKELNEKIQSSVENVNKQKIAVVDAYNAIKKANEESKKASEDTINATGEKLVEALKQEYEKKKTAELKSLKDEYDDDVKDLQDEIDKLQKKLDGLNDESTDNQTKLAKLKAERQLWLNETNNVFAKSKVTALDSQISDLEKTIQKDSLQKQIDDLNKQKSTREDSYNKQVQDTEDLYNGLEDEHKLYNKATEILTTKNTKRIKELLSSQDESFKEIGTKLGQALNDPIQQEVNDTITAINNLIDKINELNEAKGEKSSSKSSSSKSSKGDNTETTSNSNKTKTYSNGDYEDSKGYYHHVATYDTGGRTPSNIDDGAIGILHSNEKILNKDDTVMIDEIYDYIKSSGSLIAQMSNLYSNNVSYIIPNLSTNLNSIDNNLINNNTDNSNYSPVQMAVNIVNHNGAEAVMNEKSLEKAMTKIIQKSATKFGGKGFTNR